MTPSLTARSGRKPWGQIPLILAVATLDDALDTSKSQEDYDRELRRREKRIIMALNDLKLTMSKPPPPMIPFGARTFKTRKRGSR